MIKEAIESYNWENLMNDPQVQKDFENFLSWRNKEARDKQDRLATMATQDMTDDDWRDFDYYDQLAQSGLNKTDAKPSWDYGYQGKYNDPYKHGNFADMATASKEHAANESKIRKIIHDAIKECLRQ